MLSGLHPLNFSRKLYQINIFPFFKKTYHHLTHTMLTKNTVAKILESGIMHGADFTEVFVEDSISSSINLLDQKIDEINSSNSFGIHKPGNSVPETIFNLFLIYVAVILNKMASRNKHICD